MTFQLQGVLSLCNQMHRSMQKMVEARRYRLQGLTPRDADYSSLFTRMQNAAGEIDVLCRARNVTPDVLPAPSQRAYAWLRFLSEGSPDSNWALRQHLETLCLGLQSAQAAIQRSPRLVLHLSSRPIHFSIFYQASLYRAQVYRKAVTITLHEGYIGAPDDVIQTLVQSLFSRSAKKGSSPAKAYSAGEEFTEIALSLASMCNNDPIHAAGSAFHLQEVFERVNRTYFKGKMPAPRLTWSKALTRRKMGHYQPSTDTVLISLTLDNPRTPDFLIDFVMYHELLHKQLGMKVVGGRRYAHTRAFRCAERRFTHYDEAQKILRTFSHALP